MPNPRQTHRWMVVAIVAIISNVALATAVIATHRFKDVTSGNIFHDDITWLADNDITRGCNPPANDRFCPADTVTRGQMAAFMHRYAQSSGTAGFYEKVAIDFPYPSPVWNEVGSVTAGAKADADVILNANANFQGLGSGTIWLSIRVNSCQGGKELAFANSYKTGGTASMSLTARETVSGPTTFKLCAGADYTQSVATRSLTAFWLPAG